MPQRQHACRSFFYVRKHWYQICCSRPLWGRLNAEFARAYVIGRNITCDIQACALVVSVRDRWAVSTGIRSVAAGLGPAHSSSACIMRLRKIHRLYTDGDALYIRVYRCYLGLSAIILLFTTFWSSIWAAYNWSIKNTKWLYVCILLARHDDDIGNDKMAAVVVNVDDGQQNDHSTDQIQLIFNELGWWTNYWYIINFPVK